MQKTLLGLACATALSATATASDSSWLALDQEISNLSTTVVDNHTGFDVSGFLITVFESNSDDNLQGWDFNGIRLNFKGSVEDVHVKVSTDLKSGTADLKDAYVSFDVADGINLRLGQGKVPFLYSFSVSGGNLLFTERTMNAGYAQRDRGVQLSGGIGDMGHWAVGMFNAGDELTAGDGGLGDEHRLAGRVSFDVVGEGAFGKHEGGVDFFGNDETHVSVAVGMNDDEDAGGDSLIAFEAAAAMANFWLHVDFVDADVADVSPMGITASYMFQEDVEVAVRLEDMDDADDTSTMTIGANYYQVLPHAVKWSLHFQSTDSDDPTKEGDSFGLGLTVNV